MFFATFIYLFCLRIDLYKLIGRNSMYNANELLFCNIFCKCFPSFFFFLKKVKHFYLTTSLHFFFFYRFLFSNRAITSLPYI